MQRKLHEFEIAQRTSDGMFNATRLLKQWNEKHGMKKSLDHFFENQSTKDFIEVLVEEENLNTRNSVYLKSRGRYSEGTWMHPILFVKFAMWLNPRFEYFVLKYVQDQLIKFRHDAGDNYRSLTEAAQKFEDVDYVLIAKGLNYIVFGRHEKDIRQTATEEHLKELVKLQEKLAFAIDMGYINSFAELLDTMRKMWREKQNTKQLNKCT